MNDNHETLVTLTADIAAPHVAHNTVQVDQVAGLISGIYGALAGLGQPVPEPEPEYVPARPVRGSVQPDKIFSLLDGKPYKMLKRHLSLHGLTPEQYRERFNLPPEYPMVAPDYAAVRRDLAKRIGLGRHPNAARGRKKAA